MNYCPKCKLRMPADAIVCQKCGGAVRTVGGAGDAATGGPLPAGDLALQLAGLQHDVRRSRRLVAFSAGVAAVLLGLFVVLLAGLHVYHVRQFAEIVRLDVRAQGPPGEATIAFERTAAGKVEFVREADDRVETLVDHGYDDFGSESPEEEFTWSGGADDDYTLTARYRSGWSLKERRWEARGNEVRRVD